jgi:hypothetical protein
MTVLFQFDEEFAAAPARWRHRNVMKCRIVFGVSGEAHRQNRRFARNEILARLPVF